MEGYVNIKKFRVVQGFEVQGELIKDLTNVAVLEPKLVNDLIEKKGKNVIIDNKIREDSTNIKGLNDKIGLLTRETVSFLMSTS